MKWIFIYKFDSNDFFFKYKARIVIRDNLQKINNIQNLYAATFALKIFRIMMTLIVDFHFKIKQLNVVNVFLNVFNDEKIYCHMSNEYKQFKKILNSLAVELSFGQKFKSDPRVDVRPGWTDQSSQPDPRVDVRRVLSSLSETSYI